MRDQIVSPNIAQIARDFNFDWLCDGFYQNGRYDKQSTKCHNSACALPCAPTQSLLQRWFREVHGLHFIIDASINGCGYRCSVVRGMGGIYYDVGGRYDEYEGALEVCLLRAFKIVGENE